MMASPPSTGQQQKPARGVGRRAATDAVAGAAAGAFAKTIVAPIDRIKLLVQLRGSISSPRPNGTNDGAATGGGTRSAADGVKQSKSAWQVGRAIIREEGFVSLWRGNSPTILIQAGTSALNFMFMDWYKTTSSSVLTRLSGRYPSISEDGSRKRRLISSFVSGGLAGATTISFLYPLGFMRTRLAMDVGASTGNERMYPNGMRDVARAIWHTHGFRGFYKGYGIALASVTLYRVVYLGGYDFIKGELKSHGDNKQITEQLSVMQRFLAAQFVSMVASIVHYPLDSVRRRLMMEAGKSEEERMYRSSIHCFRRIAREEGFRGFYLGLGPNLVRSVGAALVLVSYDEFKRILA